MKRNCSKLISVTLILVIMMTLFCFPTLVYAGGTNGVVDQVHFAVFENSSGNIGTQIGSDDTALNVTPGQRVFVNIQGNWTVVSKDSNFVVRWRTWGGDWTATEAIGAGSGTAWEYWDSSYANYGSVTAHFSGSGISKVVETNVYTDPGDLLDLEEFWYPVEAPTATGRYELVLYDAKYLQIAETTSVQVDITVHIPGVPTVSTLAASDIGDNGATLNGNITDIGSDNVVERGFDWGLTDSYGSSWTETPGPYGTGTYSQGISGLDSATTYHFRAKVQNSYGWAYGADETFKTTGLPSHPYFQIVQGAPEKGSSTWWEWIVVNPTSSDKTCTEVRLKETGVDWNWTIGIQGYPTSGWVDGGANGLYWSGSESISAHSAKVFRVRATQGNINALTNHTLTWSATVTGESVSDVTSTCVGIDNGSWGGMFYNKPDDTAEQTEAGTYPNGLYAYLDEDSTSQSLNPGTEYTFYVNVHEWLAKAIAIGGTLTITIPKEFTGVALVDYTDFSNAAVSGGGTSDWTITGTNGSAISNSVVHLSFQATTPAGYGVDTQWELDTRFTGTGAKIETVRYITEANVLVQAATWGSFNAPGGSSPNDRYDTSGEGTVYMYGTGFTNGGSYRVIFWDGDGIKVDTRDLTLTGTVIDINHTFNASNDTAGDWHVAVYTAGANPSTYSATDPNIIIDDTSYDDLNDIPDQGQIYSFEVTAAAIPEIPTVIAGIAVAGACFWIYWWMRKRARVQRVCRVY